VLIRLEDCCPTCWSSEQVVSVWTVLTSVKFQKESAVMPSKIKWDAGVYWKWGTSGATRRAQIFSLCSEKWRIKKRDRWL